MYRIAVQTTFCAAHALTISGATEPVHGHNWRVTATIEGSELDDDGLVCDFHTVLATLQDIVAPFHNNHLNLVPPFDSTNPSAELVAKHIADELAELLGAALDPYGSRVASVSVTEAEGCEATYLPPTSSQSARP